MPAKNVRRLRTVLLIPIAATFCSASAFAGSNFPDQEPPAPAVTPKGDKERKPEKDKSEAKPAEVRGARTSARLAAVPAVSMATALAAQSHADRLLGAGDLRMATQEYAAAALANPRDPLLRMAVGVTLAEIGMTEKAAGQFQTAVSLAEDDLIASLLLQSALSEMGDGERAQEIQLDVYRRYSQPGNKGGLNADTSIRRLTEALRANPKSPVFHLLLGDAYQLSQDWPKADLEYKAAMEFAPLWAKPRVNLGISQLAQGKEEQAIRTLEDALRLNPKNAQALVWKGDAERQSGQNGAAIQTYQKLVNTRGVSRAVTVQAMTGIGQAFANSGRLDKAYLSLDEAQKMAPKDPTPSAVKGEIQSQNGNFTAAADAYGAALRITRSGGLFAQRPVLYRSLAEAQLSAHRPEKAQTTLQQALRDEPGASPLWHRLLAQAAYDQKDSVHGEAELRAALEAEQGPYPLDTLRGIDARGLMPTLRRFYEQKRDMIRTGLRSTPTGNGGIAISSAPSAEKTPAEEARTLAILANIACYENDPSRETELRDALSRLRSTGWDWFAFAELYDQRNVSPTRAAECYRKALGAVGPGSLNETAARWARQRLQVLTEPAYKPR